MMFETETAGPFLVKKLKIKMSEEGGGRGEGGSKFPLPPPSS